MKKEMNLIEIRTQFTEANALLRSAREEFITRSAKRLLWNLNLSTNDAGYLRTQVVNLVKQGYYSAKISLVSVELMFLKRLWKERNTDAKVPLTWPEFVNHYARAWGQKRHR